MTPVDGLRSALGVFYRTLPPRRRRQALFTLGLMLAGAVAEMVAVTAVLVFLTLLIKPTTISNHHYWPVVQSVVGRDADPFMVATLAFIAVMIATGLVRIALTWQTSSFSIHAGLDFSAVAFRKVIGQPYRFYLENGSDKILSHVEKIHLTNNVILAGVQALVATFLSLLLMTFLLLLDATTAITLAVLLVGTYLITSMAARATLARNSRFLALAHGERVKRIQEAVGGIRDIIIDRSQAVFQTDFERVGDRARRPQVENSVIANAPRVLIEVVGMVSISILALILFRKEGGVVGALPTLGGLAIGAQRLLPLLQQAYFGWSQFLGSRETILEVAGLLAMESGELASPARSEANFHSQVRFDRVSFSYDSRVRVLENVSFDIRKGERIGIVGRTGSGKSTLTDLLIGLLEPTGGRILIDGQVLDRDLLPNWQSQLAHVPQSIYLSDDTLAANVAFGVPAEDIDRPLVEIAAKSAGIHDFILSMPEAYETRCGERGIRLSGGQRQRIGIARALYKRASILILDEATSALDSGTEEAVMNCIGGLDPDVTIVMIAHRLTTLRDCDRILHIREGRLSETTLALLSADATDQTMDNLASKAG